METDLVRNKYPRPDFVRNLWFNLNGEWEFEFDDNDLGENQKWYSGRDLSRRIIVPFCYESKLSGIGEDAIHEIVWYRRKFTLGEELKNKRILINFDAVDFETKLWINGQYAGIHRGGYTSFSFDITKYLKAEENEIVLRAYDGAYDCTQPRGKQTYKDGNFGCWYTRVTGIWKPVWIEAVEECYIGRVKMTPDVDNGTIEL